MKNLKKLLILFLFLIGMSITITAKQSKVFADELTTDEILLGANFSQETIDELSDYTKEKIAEQVQSSLGFRHQVVTLTENPQIHNDQESGGPAKVAIKKSDLKLIATTQVVRVDGANIKQVKVRIYYDWKNLPVWRLEDPIIASWTANAYTYDGGSLHYEDHYVRNGVDHTFKTGSEYHLKNQNTLCWLADLKAGYVLGIGGEIKKLYGFGEFILNVSENSQHFVFGDLEGLYMHSIAYQANEYELGMETGYRITDNNGANTMAVEANLTYQTPVVMNPADYGFEERYFYTEKTVEHEFYNSIVSELFTTKRLRCGYIEEEYIVLSPRKSDAGTAYLEFDFYKNLYQVTVDLAFWSANEYLTTSDSQALIQYKDENNNWVTILDLLNDIELPTDRTEPKTYTISFPNYSEIKVFRFYITTGQVGTRNKGRICIGKLMAFPEL